jgi:transglutaminase-like putative cysteine protease
MLRFFVVTCALCTTFSTRSIAQSVPARSSQQIADSAEIAQLARTITRGAQTDSARAARIYEWVARNLSYDVQGFLRGRLGDGSPEEVFRKRLAVCGGYVALFQRLARESGLQSEPILGYAKGFTYRSGASTKRANHSWLAVRVGNRWRLLDPTWASGFVVGGRFERKFSWDYFLVDPNELILSHYPEEGEWQLLPHAVRRKDFERMPLVPRTLVNAGFDPAAIRTTTLAKNVRSYPLVGVNDDVRIIDAPLNGVLPRKSTVTVDVEWPGATDVAIVSGGIWYHLKREGDRFRGETVAAESTVSLVGRSNASKAFETLLQYQVQ